MYHLVWIVSYVGLGVIVRKRKALFGKACRYPLKIFRAKPVVCIKQIKVKVQLTVEVPVKRVNVPLTACLGVEVMIQDPLDDLLAIAAEVRIGIRRLDPIEKANEQTESLNDVGASQLWSLWVCSAERRFQQLLAENTTPGGCISHDLQRMSSCQGS